MISLVCFSHCRPLNMYFLNHVNTRFIAVSVAFGVVHLVLFTFVLLPFITSPALGAGQAFYKSPNLIELSLFV
jgi:hypothetical protein